MPMNRVGDGLVTLARSAAHVPTAPYARLVMSPALRTAIAGDVIQSSKESSSARWRSCCPLVPELVAALTDLDARDLEDAVPQRTSDSPRQTEPPMVRLDQQRVQRRQVIFTPAALGKNRDRRLHSWHDEPGEALRREIGQ